jgi:hypothetical protein
MAAQSKNYSKATFPALSRVLLLNKPMGVLCQFTGGGTHRTL